MIERVDGTALTIVTREGPTVRVTLTGTPRSQR